MSSLTKVSTYASLSFIAMAALLTGCGGGGGSSSSTASVSGTVEASFLQGVKVCQANTNNCATTDQNGRFTLPNVTPPIDIEVYVGDTKVATVAGVTQDESITPEVIADNNATVASYVGALLHEIAGCDLDAAICDFSNIQQVEITGNYNSDELVKIVQEALEQGEDKIDAVVRTEDGDSKDVNVTDDNATEYAAENGDKVSKEIRYMGALTGGDLAEFTFNTENYFLSYHVQGQIMGDESGTLTLSPYNGSKVFYIDQNDNFYFITKTLGAAYVNGNNGEGLVAGLQIPDIEYGLDHFINKRYNLLLVFNDGSVDVDVIEVNGTAGSTTGTWRSLMDSQGQGTWELTSNGKIDVSVSNGGVVAHMLVRPTVANSRTAIILDLLDNQGGIGIGVEAKELQTNELNSTFEMLDIAEDQGVLYQCLGSVDVNGNSYSYSFRHCTNMQAPYPQGSGTLELNPEFTTNGVSLKLNGVFRIANQDEEGYGMVDPEGGFFFLVTFDPGQVDVPGAVQALTIGGNKFFE